MRKKLFSLFLVLMMIFSLIAAAAAEAPVLISAPAEPEWELIIMHTNDVHSRYYEDATQGYIGLAKVAGEKQRLINEGKNVLLIDAGDSIHGDLITNLSKGQSAPFVLNETGYDYLVPGNHEFNYDWKRLKELSYNCFGQYLSANIVVKDSNRFLFPPYMIRNVDGKRVGFFGLTTQDTVVMAHPDNTIGLEFKNARTMAKWAVKELKRLGADYIVCIAHVGLDESATMTTEYIAKKVSGIDLIIDGHSHTVLENGKKVKKTLIASAGEYSKYVGKVTVTFDDGKFTTEAHLDNYEEAKEYPVSSKVKDSIDYLLKQKRALTDTVICSTPVDLIGEREIVRAGESNLGHLATHAFLTLTGADAVIWNGGNIRQTIKAGSITMGDLLGVMPFGNVVVTVELSGADIVKALEWGTSKYPAANGAFPHVAGITFTFNKSTLKVSDVKVGGEPVNLRKTYKLATNEFMGSGGDGYTMLDREFSGFYGIDAEMLAEYLKTYGPVFDDTPRINWVG
ncbi:MAG: Trifunctional nucleotide phosphoesterase protein YfkN precursor [Firmicutes bacterium ADurb.Bin182]|nr:MAG: Trifunctional nucleotide phosphoesterase protein YfkN precursor [Firmicutes bacterium ADurb.Bin182]